LSNARLKPLNKLVVGDYEAEIVLTRIKSIALTGIASDEIGRETEKLAGPASPRSISLRKSARTRPCRIPPPPRLSPGWIISAPSPKNPPKFLAQAGAIIRAIELDEMMRSLSYHPTGESLPLAALLAGHRNVFPH